jgi:hypothetical protein
VKVVPKFVEEIKIRMNKENELIEKKKLEIYNEQMG